MMIAHTSAIALLLFPVIVTSHIHPRPQQGPLSDNNLFHHNHQTPPNTDNIDIDYSYDLSSFQDSNSDSGSDAAAANEKKNSLLDDSDVFLPTLIVDVDGTEKTAAATNICQYTVI